MSKFIPHTENFSAVTGMVIFGGFMFGRQKSFFIITILALFFTDFIFNNYIHPEYFPVRTGLVFFSSYMIWVYLSYGLIIMLSSKFLRKFSYLKRFSTALVSSMIFYLITNFAWLYPVSLYSRDLNGIIQSYTAALPFFRTSLVSDILFSFMIFGIYDLVVSRYFIKSPVYSVSK